MNEDTINQKAAEAAVCSPTKEFIPVEFWIDPECENVHKSVDLTPVKKHDTDSGFDLKNAELLRMETGHVYVVRTGVHLKLPEGFEAVIRPRSGLAGKHGITVVNSPGTIDQEYRGEIKVLLYMFPEFDDRDQLKENMIHFDPGSRIAQLVIQKRENVKLELSESDTETNRGEKGFGSSGI